MYCKAQNHNWQLPINQTDILACNCSTGQRQQERSQLSLQKQCGNQKQCSKWPSPALKHAERRRRHWCTAAAMTSWSRLALSVLMRCLSSSRSVVRVLYTFYCSMPPPLLWWTRLKSGEFGGHSWGRMDSGVSVSSNFTVVRARGLIRKVHVT